MSKSLLLLKGRKTPASVTPKYVSNDYAIWDQPEFDKDPGPEEQKKHVDTVENQLGFLMRKTWTLWAETHVTPASVCLPRACITVQPPPGKWFLKTAAIKRITGLVLTFF